MLIDTHAHLYVEDYFEDLSQVVLRAKQVHVEKIILPNIDVSTIDLLKKATLQLGQYINYHETLTEVNEIEASIVFNENEIKIYSNHSNRSLCKTNRQR